MTDFESDVLSALKNFVTFFAHFTELAMMNKLFCVFSKIFLGCAFYSFTVDADLYSYVNALASLNYHIDQLAKDIEPKDAIFFSQTKIDSLWEKVQQNTFEENQEAYALFDEAYSSYHKKQDISRTQALLTRLWQDAIDLEKKSYTHKRICQKKLDHDNEILNGLPKFIKARIKPYVISETHPMYGALKNIFEATRVTECKKSFEDAGFKIFDIRPRSHIYVARHDDLPGYLVKANLDDDLQVKQHIQSWEWFVLRCKGAKKIRCIIKQFDIKHFTVAKKWIYPLPSTPLPPQDAQHTQHLAILLVTDMKLMPWKQNLHAWHHVITEEYLDELYTIISRAKGSSYRPDNIAYTREKTFAFIDTEYPSKGPDYDSIRNHLNPEMLSYWDKIVSQGGPSL